MDEAPPDPVEAFLRQGQAMAESVGLRDRVLTQTGRLLRRRRWGRHLGFAAAKNRPAAGGEEG